MVKPPLSTRKNIRAPAGTRSSSTTGEGCATTRYLRRLSDGRLAVAVLNAESAAKDVTVCVGDFGWPHGPEAAVRDVWHQTSAATVAPITPRAATHYRTEQLTAGEIVRYLQVGHHVIA